MKKVVRGNGGNDSLEEHILHLALKKLIKLFDFVEADIVGADVRVLSLTIICPGRPEIVLSHPFVSTPKSSLFTLKEGTKYQLKFSFMVYNNVVSGLQYMNTLWKSGIRVDRSKLMLGSFCPKKEPYGYKLEEEMIPCGILVRGSYSARIKVI
ncbi:Rho GDP-dissociation inhibitor 1 [Forsythia ovata]|uniref:Rho GDP-dissociation inhibitor 1 n=1 Tax=Forsythia ovata TaxID=205694 RepID=A0ABD1NZA0_9LAMI